MEPRTSSDTSLRIVFTPAGEDLHGSARSRGGADPLGHVRHLVDPELIKAMQAAEPHILAWLRAGRENVIAFAMDPVAALRSALPHLDPALLQRIAAIRAASRGVVPDVPGMTIDRLEVDVAPHEKGR
jgi:hypothetical protein